MTVQLKNIFSSFGYNDHKQQIALVKLLAYRNCFENDEYRDKLISDEEATTLLENLFDSIETGVAWLVEITQKNWLRASFKKEGIGKGIDLTVNVERWQILDESVSINEEVQLLSLFKTLGLVDSVAWPDKSIDQVAVYGGLENIAKERLAFIQNFSGNLYYIGNPRGLFNNEPSLALILAQWFGKPELISVIQEVLDKNNDIKISDKHWLKNLSGLQNDILEMTGETQWPVNKGWYYKDIELFEQSSYADGRPTLAGWPTAMDMVEYLIEQEKIINPGKFENIKLVPVYSVRQGRVANTEDGIEDFYKNYAQYFPESKTVVFVSNNSLGLHYIPFQEVITQEVFKRLGAQLNFVTVGAGADKINLSAATDVLAKIFYSKRAGVMKAIEKARILPSVADTQYGRMYLQSSSSLEASGVRSIISEIFKVEPKLQFVPR